MISADTPLVFSVIPHDFYSFELRRNAGGLSWTSPLPPLFCLLIFPAAFPPCKTLGRHLLTPRSFPKDKLFRPASVSYFTPILLVHFFLTQPKNEVAKLILPLNSISWTDGQDGRGNVQLFSLQIPYRFPWALGTVPARIPILLEEMFFLFFLPFLPFFLSFLI